MRYEQKAFITIEGDNLEEAKKGLERIQQAVDDIADLRGETYSISFEDGDPEEIDDEDLSDAQQREVLIDKIARKIEANLKEWEEGRSCSPDQRDFVYDALFVLGLERDTTVSEERIEELADHIYNDSGETIVTVHDIAAYLYDQLAPQSAIAD